VLVASMIKMLPQFARVITHAAVYTLALGATLTTWRCAMD